MRWTALLLLVVGCTPLDLPTQNVCFGDHVEPLVQRDCAPCHDNGEYGVTLRGDSGDFAELFDKGLVIPGNPEASQFLLWAGGIEDHPVIWEDDSPEHRTFAAWIREGAREACFDMDTYGECRDGADCADVSCYCPGAGMVTGAACYVNPATGRGVCADTTNCTNPALGICPAAGPDTVEDVVEQDAIDAGGADTPLDTGPPPVSFADDLTPLHAMDCVVCHGGGQFGVMIKGTPDDYPVVMEYVDIANPSASEWLLWANGKGIHPVNWPEGGDKYDLFLRWVEEGAQNN